MANAGMCAKSGMSPSFGNVSHIGPNRVIHFITMAKTRTSCRIIAARFAHCFIPAPDICADKICATRRSHNSFPGCAVGYECLLLAAQLAIVINDVALAFLEIVQLGVA